PRCLDLRGAARSARRIEQNILEITAMPGEFGRKRLVIRAALLIPESDQRRNACANQFAVVDIHWQVDDEERVREVERGRAAEPRENALPIAGRVERADLGHLTAPRAKSELSSRDAKSRPSSDRYLRSSA